MKIQDTDDLEAKMPVNETPKVPNGYIPIEMSTRGMLGVPKVVHCRNFSTGDLVDLSMFNEDALPEHVITVLNSLIFEDTDVSNWPDRCIVELLVKLYVNFFTPVLSQTPFPWNETDLEWLKANEKEGQAESLLNGKWTPRIDLNLTTVNIKDLDESIKTFVTFKKKDSDFSVKFLAYPRYGDAVAIRKAMEAKFEEADKKFARTKQAYDILESYIRDGRDVSKMEPISNGDFVRWQSHEARKTIFGAQAAQAMYLMEFNGKDLSKASLEEKMQYITRPEFDIKLSNKINNQFERLTFGIDPKVEVVNPITGVKCERTFTFRLDDILQAIQSSEFDEYDISYDE